MRTDTVVIGLVLIVIGILTAWLFCLGGILALVGFIVIIVGLLESEPSKVMIQTAPGVFTQVPAKDVRIAQPGYGYQPSSAPSGQAQYCQYCGRPVAPNAVYCPGCGRSFQK